MDDKSDDKIVDFELIWVIDGRNLYINSFEQAAPQYSSKIE